MTKKPLVFLMLSGGVDSSVAAVKLVEKGYNVVGVFIKNWSIDQLDKLGASKDIYNCFWEEDSRDAKLVADKLGIDFYVWDFQEEYRTKVVDYMIKGYKSGITPNPDVMCNSVIKFGIFYDKARELGADFVATGHYARIGKTQEGQKCILKGSDNNKDQTYFIWRIRQDQIDHIMFPIGKFKTKSDLRDCARENDLITANKKDSQGICFIGQTPLRDLLLETIGEKVGDIINETTGEKLGKHKGAHLYTIGQRNGLGLGQGPWFVSKIDVDKNTVMVVHKEYELELYSNNIKAVDVNWHLNLAKFFHNPKIRRFKCMAQIRYRQEAKECMVYLQEDGNIEVIFDKDVKAVAKGQSIVFYKEEVMLGGGVII